VLPEIGEDVVRVSVGCGEDDEHPQSPVALVYKGISSDLGEGCSKKRKKQPKANAFGCFTY